MKKGLKIFLLVVASVLVIVALLLERYFYTSDEVATILSNADLEKSSCVKTEVTTELELEQSKPDE